MEQIKIGIAVPPIKVGNLKYNADQIIKVLNNSKADVLLFPELNLTSLYCGDLFRNADFLDSAFKEAQRIIEETTFTGLFTIGMPLELDFYYVINALLIVQNKKIIGVEMKENLDSTEMRYFDVITDPEYYISYLEKDIATFQKIYDVSGVKIGILLNKKSRGLEIDCYSLSQEGANVLLIATGEYEILNSGVYKVELVKEISYQNRLACFYTSPSMHESSSRYVYAGDMIVAYKGELLNETTNLYDNEDYVEVELDIKKLKYDDGIEKVLEFFDFEHPNPLTPYPYLQGKTPDEAASVVNTLLVQALIKKLSSLPQHLQKVILGVSGGADSTLALLIAEQALEEMGLPSTNLIGVSMPSVNSLESSSKRALELIEGVKATKLVIPIDDYLNVHLKAIGHDHLDVTYENAQARIRTNILMDLANKYGGIVLGPSDLSEIALGFTTYNGDASSMYGLNQGVPKTLVLQTLEYLSKEVYIDLSKVIYEVSQAKPSPELLKNQVTEDVLGRYDINDFILWFTIQFECPKAEIKDYLQEVFDITAAEAQIYLDRFFKRFYQNQFKRNVLPEGPNILGISLNPVTGFRLAGDNEVEY
ncbi:MAG: NAD(+) synthase [Acholeplasmataceae bacterium]|jgi:NAD+ synthase (glutamine-hydrolysing)